MNEIIKEQPKRQYKIVNHLMMSKLAEEVNELLNDVIEYDTGIIIQNF